MSAADGVGRPIRMDHVALASRHAFDQLAVYHHRLGGRWLGGPLLDDEAPFYFCQVEFAGGTKLELLEPIPGDGSDFLRRFLDRNGPGPHHITYKVDHFDDAIDAATAAGYDVVGIDRSEPDWHEAFLHPKQSHGIVIQLAYQSATSEGWTAQEEFPPSRTDTIPTLTRVDHLVADLDSAVKLFGGPLGMDISGEGSDTNGTHVELESGPWRLRLIEPKAEIRQHWIGNRPGRLWQLCFRLPEPLALADIEARSGDGSYELPPEHNLGTRLCLQRDEADG